MRGQAKRFLRTLQTHFPEAREFKFAAQAVLRRTLRYPHERDFRALALLPFAADDLFVDVGANRGQSIQSMRLMRPGARIVAFEPDPVLHDALAARHAGDRRLHLVAAALGAEAGEAVLHVPVYRGFAFDGLASLDAAQADRSLRGGTLFGFRERRLRIERRPCRVITLDSMALAPAFVKIDTEGTAAAVLEGARATLAAHWPAIMVEDAAPGGAVDRLLAPLGYRIARHERGRLVAGRGGDLNSFFLARPDHLAVLDAGV